MLASVELAPVGMEPANDILCKTLKIVWHTVDVCRVRDGGDEAPLRRN